MTENLFRSMLRQTIWIYNNTYAMTWDMLLAPCWTFYQYLITNEIYSSDANRAAHVDLVVDEELGDYKGLTEGVPTPDTITVAMLDAWYATYNV